MSYNLNRDQARQQVVSALSHKIINGSSPEGLSAGFQSIIEGVNKSVDGDGNITTTDQSSEQIVLYENLTDMFDNAGSWFEAFPAIQTNPFTASTNNNMNTILDCLRDNTASSPTFGMYRALALTNIIPTFVDNFEASEQQNWYDSNLEVNLVDCPNIGTVVFNLFEILGIALSLGAQQLGVPTDVDMIDVDNANEILDTDIYELYPRTESRVEKIKKFFQLYSDLKGEKPTAEDYATGETLEDYTQEHDIDSNTNPEGDIPRLQQDINDPENNANTYDLTESQTLEWLYDDIGEFFEFDDIGDVDTTSQLPTYENKSTGYLQIRNPNQSIIIRNMEGNEIGLENYLTDGFTITMWVKFLDKVGSGTLFNYGNPTRQELPTGFMLETFTIHKDDLYGTDADTWEDEAIANAPNEGFFAESETERFIRLVVREPEAITDSSVGQSWSGKLTGIPEFGSTETDNNNITPVGYSNQFGLLTHTRVPIDLNEWYFIVASYDTEKNNSLEAALLNNPNYWTGNCVDQECNSLSYTSDFGNKCKVEIISKTQLLTARGFNQ